MDHTLAHSVLEDLCHINISSGKRECENLEKVNLKHLATAWRMKSDWIKIAWCCTDVWRPLRRSGRKSVPEVPSWGCHVRKASSEIVEKESSPTLVSLNWTKHCVSNSNSKLWSTGLSKWKMISGGACRSQFGSWDVKAKPAKERQHLS